MSEKIHSGEYYREAVHMYDTLVHDPMTERYFYVLITLLAAAIMLAAFIGMQSLYPLQTPIPFIVSTNDPVDDIPRIKSLLAQKGQTPSEAVLRFIVENYVITREEYDIEKFDRDINGIKAQSSPEVFRQYQQYVNPANPESPIAMYQRHSVRKINLLSSKLLPEGAEYGMEVLFEAVVESKEETKRSRWQANIAFNYSGVALDENREKVKPVSFLVTKYEHTRLQDIK